MEPEPEPEPEPQPQRRKLSKAEKKEQRKNARAAAKARARAAEAASLADGSIKEAKTSGKSHVLPKEMLEDPMAAACGRGAVPSEMPALERDHVQAVYDNVADQWDGTRYKAWPRVEAFISKQAAGSLICDSGAGNGKNLPACDSVGLGIASDFSRPLLLLGLQKPPGHEGIVGDSTVLPYREGCFDAALSIAVLHHLSTDSRRELLVQQTMRVLRIGGEALFYAWALEQEEAPDPAVDDTETGKKQAGRSGHRFDGKDVLVPFHLRVDSKASTAKIASTGAVAASVQSATAPPAHPLGLSPVHGAAAESLRAVKSQSVEAAALCETAEAAVSKTERLKPLPWLSGHSANVRPVPHFRTSEVPYVFISTNETMLAFVRSRREVSGMPGKRRLYSSGIAMSMLKATCGSYLNRWQTGW